VGSPRTESTHLNFSSRGTVLSLCVCMCMCMCVLWNYGVQYSELTGRCGRRAVSSPQRSTNSHSRLSLQPERRCLFFFSLSLLHGYYFLSHTHVPFLISGSCLHGGDRRGSHHRLAAIPTQRSRRSLAGTLPPPFPNILQHFTRLFVRI
jgi:hypothetical protein